MKSINEFVSKCSKDGHQLIRSFPQLTRVIFTSGTYPTEIIKNYAEERKEEAKYDDFHKRLVLPVSVCMGKVVINIISERCEAITTYKPKE